MAAFGSLPTNLDHRKHGQARRGDQCQRLVPLRGRAWLHPARVPAAQELAPGRPGAFPRRRRRVGVQHGMVVQGAKLGLGANMDRTARGCPSARVRDSSSQCERVALAASLRKVSEATSADRVQFATCCGFLRLQPHNALFPPCARNRSMIRQTGECRCEPDSGVGRGVRRATGQAQGAAA